MGLPSDYVETRRKWGCRPEGRGADIKLRKLQEGDGGHAAAQRHKEARRHTHERAREHTQPLGAHTSAAHAAAPRGGLQGGATARTWQSLSPRPCKGLRNRRRLQPAQPSPGWVQCGASPGKGCVPPLRREPRVGEGQGPGGGAPAPIKSPYART